MEGMKQAALSRRENAKKSGSWCSAATDIPTLENAMDKTPFSA